MTGTVLSYEELTRLNAVCNHLIRYKPDLTQEWTDLTEFIDAYLVHEPLVKERTIEPDEIEPMFVGDCEDYVTAKLLVLLNMGVPVERLRTQDVELADDAGMHQVLRYFVKPDEYYVLDNRTDYVWSEQYHDREGPRPGEIAGEDAEDIYNHEARPWSDDKWATVFSNTGISDFTPYELRCKRDGLLYVDKKALKLLQTLRDRIELPIHVLSAYRSPAYNKKVGGAPRSQHMLGKAFDIRVGQSGMLWDDLEVAAKAVGFTGIGRYDGKGFMHVDTGPERRWVL